MNNETKTEKEWRWINRYKLVIYLWFVTWIVDDHKLAWFDLNLVLELEKNCII